MQRLRSSILVAGLALALGFGIPTATAGDHDGHGPKGNGGKGGALSSATVSFGAWMTPLDRFPNVPPPPSANHHVILPDGPKIKAGGTVSFIIAGLHHVLVYDDGIRAEDIDTSLIAPAPAPPAPQVPLIDDPEGRIYRGPDPRVLFPNMDRTEVVHFAEPGTYLVMCGVLPHFQEGMYTYVRVLP